MKTTINIPNRYVIKGKPNIRPSWVSYRLNQRTGDNYSVAVGYFASDTQNYIGTYFVPDNQIIASPGQLMFIDDGVGGKRPAIVNERKAYTITSITVSDEDYTINYENENGNSVSITSSWNDIVRKIGILLANDFVPAPADNSSVVSDRFYSILKLNKGVIFGLGVKFDLDSKGTLETSVASPLNLEDSNLKIVATDFGNYIKLKLTTNVVDGTDTDLTDKFEIVGKDLYNYLVFFKVL
ncbi:MAG: hypothetical protein ACO2O4_03860 [Minisyncoccia bacterium]|jgi:hypothetical protein